MNTTRRMISLGAMVLLGGLAAGPAGRSAVAAAPSSTAAVAVVTLDYRGDAMARRGRDVSLEVFADGRIHFGNPFGTTQPLDTQLSPEQLEALLEFILVDQGFRQFDPEALRQELATAAANDPPKVTRLMDARTMVLWVRDGDAEHEVSVRALETMVVSYPDLERLRQLLVIQRRLERLRAEAYAGGPEGIAGHLERANARLAKDYPEVAPLGPEHLEAAWQSLGGRRIVKFLRSQPLTGKQVRTTKAEIDYPVIGEPRVITRVNALTLP